MSKIEKLNININFARVIGGFTSIIGGIIGYFIGRNNKSNKSMLVKVLSILSMLTGISMLGIEAEKSFKPIDEEDNTNNE